MLDMLMNGVQFLVADKSFCEKTKGIWKLVGSIVFWIQIAVPVIIILLGTIDLAKAVISGDEKKIKENLNTFLRRIIYGAAIFFIVLVVQLVFDALGSGNSEGETANAQNKLCFKCVANRGSC